MAALVKDIMQHDVIHVAPDTSVRELARILEDGGVSGVPVLDSRHRLLGVVSASDLVRLAAEEEESEPNGPEPDYEPEDVENEAASWAYFLEGDSPGRYTGMDRAVAALDARSVADIMTPAPYTVTPDTPVPELARLMLRNAIHRALVVDDGRLMGIVTTLDVLKTVAA